MIRHADAELAAEDLPQHPLGLAVYFRKRFDPDQTKWLCELAELRTRAGAKFAKADKMFFTRRGYEQSTSELIASYKSQRYSQCDSVIDLCAGIGGDAIGIGRQGCKLAMVDASESMMEIATANLRVHGLSDIEPIVSDARNIDLQRYSAWHLDPDRRVGDTRRSSPNHGDPPLDAFLRDCSHPHGAVKLAPGADLVDVAVEGAEFEWIGSGHECQQLVVWCGDLAKVTDKRTATWVWLTESRLCCCLQAHPIHSLPQPNQCHPHFPRFSSLPGNPIPFPRSDQHPPAQWSGSNRLSPLCRPSG